MSLNETPNKIGGSAMALIQANTEIKTRLARLGSWVAFFQQAFEAQTLDGAELKELSGYAVNEMLPVMGVKGAKQKSTVKFRAGGICGIHVRHLGKGIWSVSVFRPSNRTSQIADQKSGEAIQAKKDSMRTYRVNAHGDNLLRFLQDGNLENGIELTQ